MNTEESNLLEEALNQQAALDLYVRELGLLRAHANWEAQVIDPQPYTIAEQNIAGLPVAWDHAVQESRSVITMLN